MNLLVTRIFMLLSWDEMSYSYSTLKIVKKSKCIASISLQNKVNQFAISIFDKFESMDTVLISKGRIRMNKTKKNACWEYLLIVCIDEEN